MLNDDHGKLSALYLDKPATIYQVSRVIPYATTAFFTAVVIQALGNYTPNNTVWGSKATLFLLCTLLGTMACSLLVFFKTSYQLVKSIPNTAKFTNFVSKHRVIAEYDCGNFYTYKQVTVKDTSLPEFTEFRGSFYGWGVKRRQY